LVEKSSPAYKALIQNKQLLKAEQAIVRHQDALQFLSQNSQKFNLVFLDPPYHLQWLDKVLPQLHLHLCHGGLVYTEAEYALDEASEMLQGWQLIKQSKAGNVFYHLLKSAQLEEA